MKLFKWMVYLGFAGVIIGFTGLYGAYLYLARDLPPINSLHSYRPAIPSQVYADDGTLIAEFATERRRMVPIEDIPEEVKKVFIAAEDHRFLEHEGVDFWGLGAIFVHYLRTGEVRGASTLTMQLSRTFFLSRERTFERKFKEWILALRVERDFTKDEILYLYLSQVDFGRNLYGIGAASEYYFGKTPKELNQAEAAMLAGILPAPSAFNPVSNFEQAKKRQHIVLYLRMKNEMGLIDQAQADALYALPIKVTGKWGPDEDRSRHFVLQAKRTLLDRYGEDMVYMGGLQVFATVNLRADEIAAKAVEDGIIGKNGVDKQRGFELPAARLSGDTLQSYLDKQEAGLINDWIENRWSETLAEGKADAIKKKDIKAQAPSPSELEEGKIYWGVVSSVSDESRTVRVLIGHNIGRIDKKDMSWVKQYYAGEDPNKRKSYSRPSQILAAGDKIKVKMTGILEEPDNGARYALALEQDTKIQAGLFSMETRTGRVKALYGGIETSYIRPIQAKRQPGSSFKPFVYSAAIDDPMNRFTPATLIIDAPIIFKKDDQKCGITIYKDYQPKNYSGSFQGPLTLRDALKKSVNTIAVRVGCKLGCQNVADYAHMMGIKTKLDLLPCLPLGCSEVSLQEMCAGYNVFPNNGYYVEPVFISRIYDRDGNLLEYEPTLTGEDLKRAKERRAAIAIPGYEEGDTIEPPGPDVIEEDTVFSEKPSSFTRDYVHHYLSRPTPPSQLQEPSLEQYMAMIAGDTSGRITSSDAPEFGRQIISAQTAYVMNSMLRSVVRSGTATRANKLKRSVAGKTGTTNNYRDAWFIGYSPEILAGVWVGADDYRYSLGHGMSGGKAALPIWVDYMEEALKDQPKKEFFVPRGLSWVKIDKNTGLRAQECTPKENIRTEVFIKGTAPDEVSPCPVIEGANAGHDRDPLSELYR